MQADEDNEARFSKSRVRRVLIDPLVDRGLRKQKKFDRDGQAAFLDRIATRLSYMSAPGLEALIEAVEARAGGAHQNVWPDEISIVNAARAIEPPPPINSRMICSYMASAAGRAAFDRDPCEAVALLGWFQTMYRPPSPGEAGAHTWEHIREKAAERRDRAAALNLRAADGTITVADRAWLSQHHELLDLAARLVCGEVAAPEDELETA